MDNTPKISSRAREVAKDLLQLGSVQFNVSRPFTWVSGIKSPIYCDNRKINSNVEVRKRVINAFVELIKEHFPNVEVIAGVATGGIPAGALIADRLDLPFVYVRQERKEHGMMRQVEGDFRQGDKVVLIEDHISTGGSSLKAVNGMRNEGLELLGLVSVMTYGFGVADKAFEENHVKAYSLCNLQTVLEVAEENGIVTTAHKDEILRFRKSPADWVR